MTELNDILTRSLACMFHYESKIKIRKTFKGEKPFLFFFPLGSFPRAFLFSLGRLFRVLWAFKFFGKENMLGRTNTSFFASLFLEKQIERLKCHFQNSNALFFIQFFSDLVCSGDHPDNPRFLPERPRENSVCLIELVALPKCAPPLPERLTRIRLDGKLGEKSRLKRKKKDFSFCSPFLSLTWMNTCCSRAFTFPGFNFSLVLLSSPTTTLLKFYPDVLGRLWLHSHEKGSSDISSFFFLIQIPLKTGRAVDDDSRAIWNFICMGRNGVEHRA